MTERPPEIYDREWEWRRLVEFARGPRRSASLGIVYGRRRQGKTLLLESLCERTGGFYHMALEQDRALALRDLGAGLGRHLRAPGPISLPSWTHAIEAILDLGVSGPPVVAVLDEFPYLVAESPELPSVIQRALGPHSGGRSRTRLILCGSAMSMMTRLLAGAAPLRGRATLDLIVQPFGFREAAGFWGLQRSPDLAFRVHSMLGGTPAYRELAGRAAPSSVADLDRWTVRTLLNPAGSLYREGRYLLAEEPGLTDRSLYHSILTAIAEGNTRPGQIAAALQRPQTSLAHPLNVLEDLRLVHRQDDALRQRRSTYQIAEPLLRFHYAIVRPRLAQLDRGQARVAWAGAKATFLSQVLGPHFEELAREWTGRYASDATLGGRPALVAPTVASDPTGRATHQVDVVALEQPSGSRPRRVLALGEARWRNRPLGVAEAERLDAVRKLLDKRPDIDTRGARLVLFGSAGFTSALRRRKDVVLVGLDRLYRGG